MTPHFDTIYHLIAVITMMQVGMTYATYYSRTVAKEAIWKS